MGKVFLVTCGQFCVLNPGSVAVIWNTINNSPVFWLVMVVRTGGRWPPIVNTPALTVCVCGGVTDCLPPVPMELSDGLSSQLWLLIAHLCPLAWAGSPSPHRLLEDNIVGLKYISIQFLSRPKVSICLGKRRRMKESSKKWVRETGLCGEKGGNCARGWDFPTLLSHWLSIPSSETSF